MGRKHKALTGGEELASQGQRQKNKKQNLKNRSSKKTWRGYGLGLESSRQIWVRIVDGLRSLC
jgi:hypothetical protein